MGRVFPLLYWIGLVATLIGIGLRYWLGWQRLGLAVAVVGVGLLLAARLAHTVRRPRPGAISGSKH